MTLTTRTRHSGASCRRMSAAAIASRVKLSPAQARKLRVFTLIGARPAPDRRADVTVVDCLLPHQPLWHRLLAGDDDIDHICHGQALFDSVYQTVGVRR